MLEDAQASAVLTTRDLLPRMEPLARAANARLHVMDDDSAAPADLPEEPGGDDDGALIVYTSGTTGNPKGALHSHANLAAQTQALVTAWQWQAGDRILHALPLHHVHGIINALYCAHAAGATVEFLSSFSPSVVWERLMVRAWICFFAALISRNLLTHACVQREEVTVFMGVPTMYTYLLSYYDSMPAAQQAAARAAAARLRLTVSGSAACPLPIMERWHALSGGGVFCYLLVEIHAADIHRHTHRPEPAGALRHDGDQHDPVQPAARRAAAGHRGPAAARRGRAHGGGRAAREGCQRLPGLLEQARRDSGGLRPGRLVQVLLLGLRPFAALHHRRQQSTTVLRTGDTAALDDGEPPYWRILGRTSVDIIKSGGYKISAPGVESALLAHERIAECAVLGLPDEAHGEAVAAVIACAEQEVTLEELQAWAAERLPAYQVPKVLKVVEAIPRNAMGKVNKKQLKLDLFGD